MHGETIRNAVDQLVARYRNPKRNIVVTVIPASSLSLELGIGVTTWRELDTALASVSKRPLGSDYTPEWLKEHAGEIAALL